MSKNLSPAIEFPTPELWMLDLDRTILDTDSIYLLLLSAAEELGLSSDELIQAKMDAEKAGMSFDAAQHVRNRYGEDFTNRLFSEFINLGLGEPKGFLYADAQPFLDALDDTNTPHMILTYGSREWQLAKIQAAGLSNKAWIVADRIAKGSYIADLRREVYPSVHSELGNVAVRYVLVDDKLKSFEGLPDEDLGYLVIRSGSIIPTQENGLPLNILVCDDLGKLAAHLQDLRV